MLGLPGNYLKGKKANKLNLPTNSVYWFQHFSARLWSFSKLELNVEFQSNHSVLHIKLKLKNIVIQCSLVHKDVSVGIHNTLQYATFDIKNFFPKILLSIN